MMGLKGTPILKVHNRKRGWAHPSKGYFTIPLWATKQHQAYAIAYVIHELSHFAPSKYQMNGQKWLTRGHGKTLRVVESETAEKFGLRLVYRGTCYLSEVRHLETNRKLCDGYGRPHSDTDWYEHPACLI